jgi:dihydrofolate reductase
VRSRTVLPEMAHMWFGDCATQQWIDEYIVTLVPYVAGEGPRLFEDAGKSRQLDLLSSTAITTGLQLHYQRHR